MNFKYFLPMKQTQKPFDSIYFRSLPKADLHRHLDCSMRWSTMVELALTAKIITTHDLHQLQSQLLVLEPMNDLASVLKKFLNTQKLLSSEETLERLAYEACEDAFNDGVQLIELRYAPTFINEKNPDLTYEKIHQAFLRGTARAEKKFKIVTGLIGIVQRIKPLELAASVTDFMIENKDTFIAIDLADSEEGFDPKLFAPCFIKAKKNGLHVTIHSGEVPNKDSANWVKDSIELLGAERIGHGIQIVNNPDIMDWIAKKEIPLEVCPHSNFLTQSFKNYSDHPINILRNAGVKVTINSDDPGVFASTLTDDYLILKNYHGWNTTDFQNSYIQSLESSFISNEKKKHLLQPREA